MVSNAFNAQTWMNIVLQIFDAEYGPIKGFKSMLVASMKSAKVSQDFQMKKAIAEAIKFASMHVKKPESINNKNQ